MATVLLRVCRRGDPWVAPTRVHPDVWGNPCAKIPVLKHRVRMVEWAQFPRRGANGSSPHV